MSRSEMAKVDNPWVGLRFVRRVQHAWHGILHIVEYEKSARTHLLSAIAALAAGLALRIPDEALAAVFFAVIIVFLAEIFNSAIERTLDLIDMEDNPRIKLIKDMSAGGVMVASLAAVIVGIVTFLPVVLRMLWAH